MKADPNNAEVIKWLPDAYRMKLSQAAGGAAGEAA